MHLGEYRLKMMLQRGSKLPRRSLIQAIRLDHAAVASEGNQHLHVSLVETLVCLGFTLAGIGDDFTVCVEPVGTMWVPIEQSNAIVIRANLHEVRLYEEVWETTLVQRKRGRR